MSILFPNRALEVAAIKARLLAEEALNDLPPDEAVRQACVATIKKILHCFDLNIVLANGAALSLAEVYAIPPDSSGWRELPDGNTLHLGEHVQIGTGVRLGDRVRLLDCVKIGNNVSIGKDTIIGRNSVVQDCAAIGADVVLGHYTSIGEHSIVEDWASIGDSTGIGNRVRVMKGAQLGARVHVGAGLILSPPIVELRDDSGVIVAGVHCDGGWRISTHGSCMTHSEAVEYWANKSGRDYTRRVIEFCRLEAIARGWE